MPAYILEKPTPGLEQQHRALLASCAAAGEKQVPMAADIGDAAYADWLRELTAWESTPPASFVPATLYAFMDDAGTLLGFLHLRHTLNAGLTQTGGHIGYGLHPAQRGKGLAPIMLGLGLQKAREMGIEKALVTCDKTNTPSAKTIQKCGGVLENEHAEPSGNVVQRYWIAL